MSATAGLLKAASIKSSAPSMHFLGGDGGGVFALGGYLGGSSIGTLGVFPGVFNYSFGGYLGTSPPGTLGVLG